AVAHGGCWHLAPFVASRCPRQRTVLHPRAANTLNRILQAMRNIVNALLVRGGSVLLAKRSSQRASYPGQWSFPGGRAEANETLPEALVEKSARRLASPQRDTWSFA